VLFHWRFPAQTRETHFLLNYQANIARLTSAILTSYSLWGEERQEPEPVIYHPIPHDVHPEAIHFPQFV